MYVCMYVRMYVCMYAYTCYAHVDLHICICILAQASQKRKVVASHVLLLKEKLYKCRLCGNHPAADTRAYNKLWEEYLKV